MKSQDEIFTCKLCRWEIKNVITYENGAVYYFDIDGVTDWYAVCKDCEDCEERLKKEQGKLLMKDKEG